MWRRDLAGDSVMVVSHEASRTGAPRVAIQVLEALAPLGMDRIALLRWPGPLVPEFASTGASVQLEPMRRLRVVLRRWRPTRGLAVRLEEAVAVGVLRWRRPSVVYLNTVKSASYVRAASRLGVPTILHVHEAEASLISSTLGRYRLESSHYRRLTMVACSGSVSNDVAAFTGVPVEDIAVVYSVGDAAHIRRLAAAEPVPLRPLIRPALVGTVGSADRRKGVDRWVALAAKVTEVAPDLDVGWVWVGEYDPAVVAALVAASGVEDRVHFVGPTANPFPLMASFDVFTMTSRFDAFPLAVMEAMILGRPVVGFDVGGIGEQLGDTGMLIPDGDIDAMAAAVVRLLRDEPLRGDLGTRAAVRAEQRFGMDRFGEQVRALVTTARRSIDRGGAATTTSPPGCTLEP